MLQIILPNKKQSPGCEEQWAGMTEEKVTSPYAPLNGMGDTCVHLYHDIVVQKGGVMRKGKVSRTGTWDEGVSLSQRDPCLNLGTWPGGDGYPCNQRV